MSEYVPPKPANVVIGVCGDQGSGKTVFLTCIFQSVTTAFPDDVVVGFDRSEIGNASYFQSVEQSLIERGAWPGTRELHPVRILVNSYEPLPGAVGSTLSVDLLDFAGGHFQLLADLKKAEKDLESDEDELKEFRTVEEMLHRADAFAILINSTEIDPEDEAPTKNPFSTSVNFMLGHCRQERKPVALLFTRVDQTPALTEKIFEEMPRVEMFRRQFTDSLEEAEKGAKPFGVARRISCYETVLGDLTPKGQTYDGNIWRKEPAQIVLELIRAAMPAIRRRLEEEAARAARELAEKELLHRQQRTRWLSVGIAAALGILILIGTLAFVSYGRAVARQVGQLKDIELALRGGNVNLISSTTEANLADILASYRRAPADTPSEVVSAIRSVEAAFGEAGQRLVSEPWLDPAYRDKIDRYQVLAPRFDPAVSDLWRKTLLPTLAARGEFLADWLSNKRQDRRARTFFLDEESKRFEGLGDRRFSALLASRSTKEKTLEIARWQRRIDANADVRSRIATIQNLFDSALAEHDPELIRLARISLARHFAGTLMQRQENPIVRENLLTPLAPDLARLGDGQVRFEVLARELLNCASEEQCQRRLLVIQSVISDDKASTAGWQSSADNLLRSLLFGLPRNERREVWNALAGSLGDSYLFSARPDAWPADVSSLLSRIRTLTEGEVDATPELVKLLTRHPIYAAELEYLADRLAATEVRRTMVSIYALILHALRQSSMLPSGQLTQISHLVSSAVANRGEAGGPFHRIDGELTQVLTLVQSVNNQRSRGSFKESPASVRLERLLRDAKRSHCNALIPHQAPAECADAA